MEHIIWDESMSEEDLEIERINLDIQLPVKIIIIADLGLWNGRRSAYKEISENIKDCLYSHFYGYCKWFLDENGDLCGIEEHHDGTNHYRFRAIRSGVSDTSVENLKHKIYCGTATEKDIARVTRRIGDYIAESYGWKIKSGIHI